MCLIVSATGAPFVVDVQVSVNQPRTLPLALPRLLRIQKRAWRNPAPQAAAAEARNCRREMSNCEFIARSTQIKPEAVSKPRTGLRWSGLEPCEAPEWHAPGLPFGPAPATPFEF